MYAKHLFPRNLFAKPSGKHNNTRIAILAHVVMINVYLHPTYSVSHDGLNLRNTSCDDIIQPIRNTNTKPSATTLTIGIVSLTPFEAMPLYANPAAIPVMNCSSRKGCSFPLPHK